MSDHDAAVRAAEEKAESYRAKLAGAVKKGKRIEAENDELLARAEEAESARAVAEPRRRHDAASPGPRQESRRRRREPRLAVARTVELAAAA